MINRARRAFFATLSKKAQMKQAEELAKMLRVDRFQKITPELVGNKYKVHNGKDFIAVEVVPEMVGKKFGAFADPKKRSIKAKKR
eukprot:snap_masked-scaffold_78-processed-gene-0.53-mRNA-1 protein AED:1.00 eAED:1.00 QI:0/-1/0/0/-1/1/1/0/84